MSDSDEFHDPVPIIREWIKRNRSADALILSQFETTVAQYAMSIHPGYGLFAWMAIAFAAGREYGETKNAKGQQL